MNGGCAHARPGRALGDQGGKGADGDEDVPARAGRDLACPPVELLFARTELEHVGQDGDLPCGWEGGQASQGGLEGAGVGVVGVIADSDAAARLDQRAAPGEGLKSENGRPDLLEPKAEGEADGRSREEVRNGGVVDEWKGDTGGFLSVAQEELETRIAPGLDVFGPDVAAPRPAEGHSPAAEPKKISVSDLTAKQASSAALAAAGTKKLPSKPINLTMRQAELKTVLRAMAKSVDLNLMLKNDLKGEITVDFRGVPWDQAFVGLLRTHGLTYVWEGDIILVKTADDIEHDLKQKVQLRDIQWVEPLLQPVVISIDYADSKKLTEMLQDLLTKDKDGKPRGSIKLDEHSNSLVISAMRNDLEKILPIIEKIDKPTPQILIKANIVETTKEVARDLGIMWGGKYGSGDYTAMGGGTRISSTDPINPTAGGPVGIGASSGFVSNFQSSNLSSVAVVLLTDIGGHLVIVKNPSGRGGRILKILKNRIQRKIQSPFAAIQEIGRFVNIPLACVKTH